jgi:transposase
LKRKEFADSFWLVGGKPEAMMGPRQVDQAALFYEFSLERHVPATHLLRSIDRFVDLSDVRSHLAPFYSSTGGPSIDPELLVRMLLVGYCYGIRSERRLCEEVHLNLAYRWFCRLGLDGEVPDHSTFSKNRHGRFRDCDLLRKLFERSFGNIAGNQHEVDGRVYGDRLRRHDVGMEVRKNLNSYGCPPLFAGMITASRPIRCRLNVVGRLTQERRLRASQLVARRPLAARSSGILHADIDQD